ncbi:hypothetical protein PanWU01x14_094980 [Parasponia andersonii]|uniref:Uncharacterized protein n=1 Tax=Parasponia andersonii TaxID=3476 RepID=A0A2P5D5G3_PARAD|nr:hypothetical protein PanWU01x14_094980 [Parasponia andersonii]
MRITQQSKGMHSLIKLKVFVKMKLLGVRPHHDLSLSWLRNQRITLTPLIQS